MGKLLEIIALEVVLESNIGSNIAFNHVNLWGRGERITLDEYRGVSKKLKEKGN